MQFILLLVCLFCVSQNILGRRIEKISIDYNDEIAYQEIININASCFPRDSCTEERHNDISDIPAKYACSCDRQCWKFGACCVDSPYRVKDPAIHKCRTDYVNETYYMVRRCPGNIDIDYLWKDLCEKDWNQEDDILMLSPVTSLDTSTTYYNYYCFRCHEETDNYILWNVLLLGRYETGYRHSYGGSNDSSDDSYGGYNHRSVDSYGDGNSDRINYSVTYNKARMTWVANDVEHPVDKYPISIPVSLRFVEPHEGQISLISCRPEIISDCRHTWTHKHVRDKCLAYTAVVYGRYSIYKNPHCALCNYEYPGDLTCKQIFVGGGAAGGYGGEPFSFEHMIKISAPDRNNSEKPVTCGDGYKIDMVNKKCRKITCVMPDHVFKDGKCGPP